MQARQIGRPNPTSQARLQLILVLLAAWDLLAFLLELTNTRLLSIGKIEGVLGARSVSGTVAVLAIAYLYAARNPMRHRFVLWLASLEQFVALFSATFHFARGDVGFGQAIVPILVAAGFLVLLMTSLPRQTDAI
ncbi:MAG TPA: hypothetical protein VEZ14_08550 [Dehalococcoidia bacterium]|nr:hypothetical protein [Dehalococcoidia bacterium]